MNKRIMRINLQVGNTRLWSCIRVRELYMISGVTSLLILIDPEMVTEGLGKPV